MKNKIVKKKLKVKQKGKIWTKDRILIEEIVFRLLRETFQTILLEFQSKTGCKESGVKVLRNRNKNKESSKERYEICKG